jgi:hypothetical protein
MRMEALARAYTTATVGCDAWIRPEPMQTLEDFQAVVAAAEAWEAVRHIKILEIVEEKVTGRRLIHALRFRRLK